jgi:hypothetical protein
MAECGYSPMVGLRRGLRSGDVESVPFPKDSKDVDERRLGVTACCETLKAHSCASHVRTTETEV